MLIRHITTAALALALSSGAAFAQWSGTTMPLGGGMYSGQYRDNQGNSASSTTIPLGGGMYSTQWRDSEGNRSNCTTMPLGGGMTSTSCR